MGIGIRDCLYPCMLWCNFTDNKLIVASLPQPLNVHDIKLAVV